MANPQYNKMMKQVQEMQRKMAQAQEELAVETVEASAGGGVVTVVVTGSLEVKEVRINPDAVDPEDVEMLQDLVVAAHDRGRSTAVAQLGRRETPPGDAAPGTPVCRRVVARLECVYRTHAVRNATPRSRPRRASPVMTTAETADHSPPRRPKRETWPSRCRSSLEGVHYQAALWAPSAAPKSCNAVA